MEYITLITAIAGLVFGVLGTVFGIINTWRAILHDRVWVKVVPVWVGYGNGAEGIGIQVVNLGFIPITITHIGFTLRDSDEHMPFFPQDITGCRLPERMEARTCFTAFIPLAACNHPNFSRVHRAYADTACRRRFTGTSKALRQYVKGRGARKQG